MKNHGSWNSRSIFEAGDPYARDWTSGVSLRCEHYANTRARSPLRAKAAEVAACSGHARLRQVEIGAQKDRLCFGIAQAAIIFKNLRTNGCKHQPKVKKTFVR